MRAHAPWSGRWETPAPGCARSAPTPSVPRGRRAVTPWALHDGEDCSSCPDSSRDSRSEPATGRLRQGTHAASERESLQRGDPRPARPQGQGQRAAVGRSLAACPRPLGKARHCGAWAHGLD